MPQSKYARRLVENEVVFRQHNEQVTGGLKALRQLAEETNQISHVPSIDVHLQFYCECSDENCHKRIKIKPDEYDRIHKQRDRFIVICGHEVPAIEHIVSEESEYCIVKKYKRPPETAKGLNKTDINNE